MIPTTDRFIAVMISLFLFGCLYAVLVAVLRYFFPRHGYTAELVIFGVLVTLAGFAVLVGPQLAVLALACFAASGFPMALGDGLANLWISRHERARNTDDAQDLLKIDEANRD